MSAFLAKERRTSSSGCTIEAGLEVLLDSGFPYKKRSVVFSKQGYILLLVLYKIEKKFLSADSKLHVPQLTYIMLMQLRMTLITSVKSLYKHNA